MIIRIPDLLSDPNYLENLKNQHAINENWEILNEKLKDKHVIEDLNSDLEIKKTEDNLLAELNVAGYN